MTETPTYNHAYSLGFAVSGSKYESPDECVQHEPMLVLEGLLVRVIQLLDHSEMREACDGFDTYEETK